MISKDQSALFRLLLLFRRMSLTLFFFFCYLIQWMENFETHTHGSSSLARRSWQGLPRIAQWGHLSPTAICAQVLLIQPSESTFLIPLPQPLLPFKEHAVSLQ